MPYRLEHKYNHHYSDMSDDSGTPIGTIMCVFVDTNGNNAADVANNYPGWLYCDGAQHSANDYPILYDIIGDKYGGTDPSTVTLSDWGNSAGTVQNAVFNVPDLRMKRVVGPGGIDGSGSITPDDAQMNVGDVGGEWYISRARQNEEYGVGSVRVTGYQDCIGFVGGTLSGYAELTIGPLQSRILTGPPAHGHIVLTSERDQRNAGDNGSDIDGNKSPNYITNTAPIDQWDPTGGQQAEHAHYLAEYTPVKTGTNQQYSYCTSEPYASLAGQNVNPQTFTLTITHSNVGSVGEEWVVSGTDRNGAVSGRNPTLNFVQGDTITFNVTTIGNHPFYINTVSTIDDLSQLPSQINSTDYSDGGVFNNGEGAQGTPSVPDTGAVILYTSNIYSSYATLYYNGNQGSMAGVINIASSSGATAYTNVYGADKVNDGAVNDKGQTVTMFEKQELTGTNGVTPQQAGITLNEGTITMTPAEQLSVTAGIVPQTAVPLVLKYFRVKYLIKAW